MKKNNHMKLPLEESIFRKKAPRNQYTFKQKYQTPQIQYIAGRVFFENDHPVVISRGKQLQHLEPPKSEQRQLKLPSQRIRSTTRDIEYLHDRQVEAEYEKNRKNRFQIMRALPKIVSFSYSNNSEPQRILTRRDLTMNRILVQSLFQ